jgi:hypothetical protein
MTPMTEDRRLRQTRREAGADSTLREDMEATSRAHLAADNAYVDEAMLGVRWERRGLLQRLTRGDR